MASRDGADAGFGAYGAGQCVAPSVDLSAMRCSRKAMVESVDPGLSPAGGAMTVSWKAHDADGDPLAYDVFYSPGGVRFYLRAIDLRADHFRLSARNSFPGDHPQVKVAAGDGFDPGPHCAPQRAPDRGREHKDEERPKRSQGPRPAGSGMPAAQLAGQLNLWHANWIAAMPM